MAKVVRMCPKCHSTKLTRYDTYTYEGHSKPRYKCGKCGRLTIYPLIKLVAERKKKKKDV